MNDGRFHFGTFVTGLVLALIGGALLAEGMGWWKLRLSDFRYVAPALLIAIGVIVLLGSFARRDTEG
jgi:xanthine/uracil permease